jgi:hypothetical protein
MPTEQEDLLPVLNDDQTERRGPGRPKKPRPEKVNLLPVMAVDLSQSPDEMVLPCSEVEQSRYLDWRLKEVRSVNRTLSLYDDIPMLCQGSECHWAKLCPTATTGFQFLGVRCPYEIRTVFRLFVQYVRELEVAPEDGVDLSLVGDLIRIDIGIRRMDQQVQIQGQFIEKIGGVSQKDGVAFKEKQLNPLIDQQRKLRQERLAIYDKLLQTREAKRKVELAKGKTETNIVTFMTNLRKAAIHLHDSQIIDSTPMAMPSGEDYDESDPFGTSGE